MLNEISLTQISHTQLGSEISSPKMFIDEIYEQWNVTEHMLWNLDSVQT